VTLTVLDDGRGHGVHRGLPDQVAALAARRLHVSGQSRSSDSSDLFAARAKFDHLAAHVVAVPANDERRKSKRLMVASHMGPGKGGGGRESSGQGGTGPLPRRSGFCSRGWRVCLQWWSPFFATNVGLEFPGGADCRAPRRTTSHATTAHRERPVHPGRQGLDQRSGPALLDCAARQSALAFSPSIRYSTTLKRCRMSARRSMSFVCPANHHHSSARPRIPPRHLAKRSPTGAGLGTTQTRSPVIADLAGLPVRPNVVSVPCRPRRLASPFPHRDQYLRPATRSLVIKTAGLLPISIAERSRFVHAGVTTTRAGWRWPAPAGIDARPRGGDVAALFACHHHRPHGLRKACRCPRPRAPPP